MFSQNFVAIFQLFRDNIFIMFNPIVEEGKAIFFLEYAHVKPAFPAGLQGRHGEFEQGKGPIFYFKFF